MTIHASVPPKVHELSPQLRDQLDTSLRDAAARRERQLAELPPTHEDLVAAAHRECVGRILAEIRSAQERLAAGPFGRCDRCGDAIPVERLELRPWTTLCVGCAPVARP